MWATWRRVVILCGSTGIFLTPHRHTIRNNKHSFSSEWFRETVEALFVQMKSKVKLTEWHRPTAFFPAQFRHKTSFRWRWSAEVHVWWTCRDVADQPTWFDSERLWNCWKARWWPGSRGDFCTRLRSRLSVKWSNDDASSWCVRLAWTATLLWWLGESPRRCF